MSLPAGLGRCAVCAAGGAVCGAIVALWWVGRNRGPGTRGTAASSARDGDGKNAVTKDGLGLHSTDTIPGKVYLVGAGPGGVGLITVRGFQLLQQATVLVTDELADAEFSALVRSTPYTCQPTPLPPFSLSPFNRCCAHVLELAHG